MKPDKLKHRPLVFQNFSFGFKLVLIKPHSPLHKNYLFVDFPHFDCELLQVDFSQLLIKGKFHAFQSIMIQMSLLKNDLLVHDRSIIGDIVPYFIPFFHLYAA